jgi:hypothetical protein
MYTSRCFINSRTKVMVDEAAVIPIAQSRITAKNLNFWFRSKFQQNRTDHSTENEAFFAYLIVVRVRCLYRFVTADTNAVSYRNRNGSLLRCYTGSCLNLIRKTWRKRKQVIVIKVFVGFHCGRHVYSVAAKLSNRVIRSYFYICVSKSYQYWKKMFQIETVGLN